MSKKTLFLLLGLGLLAATASAQLRSGESAIYLKSGDLVVDRIVDISSTRLVLQTAASGEFPLRDIWLINYVNDQWDFPQERDQIETNEPYFFLKNGDVLSGRIIDFSSTRKVFQLQTGDEIAPGRIRRIYFSRRVPAGLQSQGGGETGGNVADAIAGIYKGVANNRNIELRLETDGSARLLFNADGRRQSMVGRWGLKRGEEAILVLTMGGAADRTTMTFGRDGEMLIGIVYDKALLGNMRLRRQ